MNSETKAVGISLRGQWENINSYTSVHNGMDVYGYFCVAHVSSLQFNNENICHSSQNRCRDTMWPLRGLTPIY